MSTTPTWSTLGLDQSVALRTSAARLGEEFAGIYGPETIERFPHSSSDQFATAATVPTFLPHVAEGFAHQRLRVLAEVEGLRDDGNATVLFLAGAGLGLTLVNAVLQPAQGELLLCARGVHQRYSHHITAPCEHPATGTTATVLLPLSPRTSPCPDSTPTTAHGRSTFSATPADTGDTL
jgi:hypothetical protein